MTPGTWAPECCSPTILRTERKADGERVTEMETGGEGGRERRKEDKIGRPNKG